MISASLPFLQIQRGRVLEVTWLAQGLTGVQGRAVMLSQGI